MKLWPRKSEQQNERFAEKIAKDVMDVLNCGRVLLRRLRGNQLEDWKDRVYKPDIKDKSDKLYKKPGYEM